MDLTGGLMLLALSGVPDNQGLALRMAAPEQQEIHSSVRAMPSRLGQPAVQHRLEALPPGWTTDGETLFYDRTFEEFVTAIAIHYNRVSLALTTHDAGGLTELDFQLAAAISALTETEH